MHARNLHKDGYPIAALCQAHPALSGYVVDAKSGKKSIDFTNQDAVKTLNAALLIHYYGLKTWDIPNGYLCPPVPGRADYIHGIADILASSNKGVIPKGKSVKGLDVGIGANAIYPIIGSQSYGWQFVGSDIDAVSVKSAESIATKNPKLTRLLSVRKQPKKSKIFEGVIQLNEHFTFTMCNPPFHKSAEAAALGSERKAIGLKGNMQKRSGKKPRVDANANTNAKPDISNIKLNFAGTGNELWCEGGELAFIQRMIIESVAYKKQVDWFTCLVSKSEHLKPIETSINYYGATKFLKVDMGQGQKQSRFVAWTFTE
ncbi:23S rRNA (adenine(1618)-N(6))-methyltransferase RlmF [Alteromonas sp. 1_MG-2023]|uniref:23S rRNA (adenine(1618)-N(6))-methyltransferase RlmF n=1 Tax=Alteromonas sp. 1_MG-2023 TaxID=3062669 RepID=UPI0026E1FCEB|nr:23S rRNA (adenine(1618)-N(6))-methyltransferase RlmF [Alteromonas sp. 1_MG-2023]MDO6566390.1 23S rRNA (adenine(1618)-N(6))-methyltransferase RlmF [Alteromonas sp. 1_MG-2023]